MSPALLVLLVAGAISESPLERGTSSSEPPRLANFGLSAGFDFGARPSWWFSTGEVNVVVDLNLTRTVGLRVGAGTRAGTAGLFGFDDLYFAVLGGHLSSELRLALGGPFSLGLGLELGFLNVGFPTQYMMFFFAPTLTAAVRLGSRREHELSLTASLIALEYDLSHEDMTVIASTLYGTGGFGIFRYSYFF